MAFQEFSKNYLDILMASVFKHSLVPSFRVWLVIFCVNLNEVLLLASTKSVIKPALFEAGLSLYCCHELPDLFLIIIAILYQNIDWCYYSIIYFFIVYFAYVISKWSTI